METTWKWYTHNEPLWDAMLSACESAARTIDCEQFIFEIDDMGERFADMFILKARSGVKVRLLVDAMGSYGFLGSALAARMQEAGIVILFYSSLRFWRPKGYASRIFCDHRKMLIVDQDVAFTGGSGITSRMRQWRDTNIEIRGPIVEGVQDSFNIMWRIAEKRRFLSFPYQPNHSLEFSLAHNAPRFRQHYVYRAIRRAIVQSKTRVLIATPYFVPRRRIVRAIAQAAERGVEVRLMLPQASDFRVADLAGRSYIMHLLKVGVQVYLYQGTMFHTKAIVVDDTWATMGSTNLDSLSFYNYEMNLVSTQPHFVQQLKEQFLKDIPQCHAIGFQEWQQRPLMHKIAENLTRPFHAFI